MLILSKFIKEPNSIATGPSGCSHSWILSISSNACSIATQIRGIQAIRGHFPFLRPSVGSCSYSAPPILHIIRCTSRKYCLHPCLYIDSLATLPHSPVGQSLCLTITNIMVFAICHFPLPLFLRQQFTVFYHHCLTRMDSDPVMHIKAFILKILGLQAVYIHLSSCPLAPPATLQRTLITCVKRVS